ncbi:hypothetical protein HAX54_040519, partial [Datura stramonium]|nr:hypothetical protein [Datura stramonium]
MTSSRRQDTGKDPMTAAPSQEREAEEYEARKLTSPQKTSILDKDNQFALVARIIVEGRLQWAVLKGKIHHPKVKFEAHIWIDLVCAHIIPSKNTTHVPIEVAMLIACIMEGKHINVGKVIVDKFKQKARQKDTSIPYPILISLLYLQSNCMLFRPLDKTKRAEGVITLATKRDKDAPFSKRPKLTLGPNTPLPAVLMPLFHYKKAGITRHWQGVS